MKILVTGGLGYIGSHTVVELFADGHEVVIADNLANAKFSVLERLQKISGKNIAFEQIDVANKSALTGVFERHQIEGVIHFAGLKSVGGSVAQPLQYYRTNIDTTLSLCEVMLEKGVQKLIFSSSATVYGPPSELPLKETSQIGIGITSPYGQTKFMIEQVLQDLTVAEKSMQVIALRYFNPIGAHASGTIGEDPNGVPSNLLPYVQQVAVGKLKEIHVTGNDYDTPDGTGVRDYIHVVDLAKGHVAAFNHIASGFSAINLGTGKGTSVMEMIKAFRKACGKELPYVIDPRRPGDIAACYADVSKAQKELGWRADKTIEEACVDAWKWQQYAAKNLE